MYLTPSTLYLPFLFLLSSNKDMVVPAKGKALVPTDLQIALPEGCYGRIAPRSGLAAKKFIDVGGIYLHFTHKDI